MRTLHFRPTVSGEYIVALWARLSEGKDTLQQFELTIKPRQIAHPRPGQDFTVPAGCAISDKLAMAIGVHGVDVVKLFSCMVADAQEAETEMTGGKAAVTAWGARYGVDFRWPREVREPGAAPVKAAPAVDEIPM